MALPTLMGRGSGDWPTPAEATLATTTNGNAGEDATQDTAAGGDEEAVPELLTRGERAATTLLPNAEGDNDDGDISGNDAQLLTQAPLTQEPETPALLPTQAGETPALQGGAPTAPIEGLLTQAEEVEPQAEPVGGENTAARLAAEALAVAAVAAAMEDVRRRR